MEQNKPTSSGCIPCAPAYMAIVSVLTTQKTDPMTPTEINCNHRLTEATVRVSNEVVNALCGKTQSPATVDYRVNYGSVRIRTPSGLTE